MTNQLSNITKFQWNVGDLECASELIGKELNNRFYLYGMTLLIEEVLEVPERLLIGQNNIGVITDGFNVVVKLKILDEQGKVYDGQGIIYTYVPHQEKVRTDNPDKWIYRYILDTIQLPTEAYETYHHLKSKQQSTNEECFLKLYQNAYPPIKDFRDEVEVDKWCYQNDEGKMRTDCFYFVMGESKLNKIMEKSTCYFVFSRPSSINFKYYKEYPDACLEYSPPASIIERIKRLINEPFSPEQRFMFIRAYEQMLNDYGYTNGLKLGLKYKLKFDRYFKRSDFRKVRRLLQQYKRITRGEN